jgi:hypothetical protein
MVRTTVALPEDLKRLLKEAARAEGRSEAELIREGVRRVVHRHATRPPTIPLFTSDDPTLAEHVDEYLRGFGER